MNILGVDIGGTAVKLGIVDQSGHMLAREEHSVCFDGYRTPILETVMGSARGFLRRCARDIRGIGISATGQVDGATGVVVGTCGNLPSWVNTPIKSAFEEAFQKPVTVMNDANCALLGEAWTGGAQGYRDVVMVTLGTGVGGGVLVDGRVLGGRIGIGGEIGHMPLRHGGRPCTCGDGSRRYASVTALLDRAEARLGARPEGAKALFDRAAQGDAAMLALLDAWRDDIAAGLVGLVHLFNPALILLGGGVSRQNELLIQPLRERVLRLVMPPFADALRIEAATLGNDAGLIGAARHWLDQQAT